MQNLESLHEVVFNLKAYYQQILENNQAAIAKLQDENSLIEVQIHHADALLLGHQVFPEKALQLVVEQEPPPLPPQTNKRVAPNIGKKRKNRGSSPPLSEQYQGMSVLAAAAEVIKSRCGEVLSVMDIFAVIFLPHSKRTQADLRNLLSRELSRGVKEKRFYRVRNIAGHYTWDLSKIKKVAA